MDPARCGHGHRVCVDDRAVTGWSEPAETPQDGVAIATDLHTLLRRAEIDGQYVLAGHSSGGVYAQVFAAQYPDEVAGLVLLDSQPPDAIANLPGYAGEYDGIRRFTALFPSVSRLGVGRLAYPSAASGLPPEAWAEARALLSTGSHNRGYRDDAVGLEAALTQAQALPRLGDSYGRLLDLVLTARRPRTPRLPGHTREERPEGRVSYGDRRRCWAENKGGRANRRLRVDR